MPNTPTDENLIDVDELARRLKEGPLAGHVVSIQEIVNIAQKGNHTTKAVGAIIGDTTEERVESLAAMSKLRFLLHFLHKKRYDTAMGMIVFYIGLSALQKMGFPVKEIGVELLKLVTALNHMVAS